MIRSHINSSLIDSFSTEEVRQKGRINYHSLHDIIPENDNLMNSVGGMGLVRSKGGFQCNPRKSW